LPFTAPEKILSLASAQGVQPMNPNITFETALQFLTIAHVASLMLLLTVSNFLLAVIETFEKVDD